MTLKNKLWVVSGAVIREGEAMKPAGYGPFYAAGLYPKLAELFREYGYALAVHGSVGTDFDLIAVPWVDEAGEPQDVVEAVLKKFAFDKIPGQHKATPKPHSRIAYKLHMSFGDCALDVSFTPRTGEWGGKIAKRRAEAAEREWNELRNKNSDPGTGPTPQVAESDAAQRKVEELRGLLRESYRKLRDTCSCGACENLIARVAAVLGEKR